MPNIFFQISGLLYVILIQTIYIQKNKINTLENYTYRSLIICSMVTTLADIASIMIAKYQNMPWLSVFFSKVYLWGFVTWLIIFTFYMVIITSSRNKDGIFLSRKNEDTTYFLKLLKKVMIINVISIALIYILPLEVSLEGTIIIRTGLSVLVSYAIVGICISKIIMITVKSKEKLTSKKIRPVAMFIAMFLLATLLQEIRPDLLMISAVLSYITVLIYYNFENPDLRAIEEINLATRQAEAANRAKSDFLSSMSHEIRTPLNAIVGFSQALAKEEISGAAKDEVREILNASTSLLETVNGILDVSKLEAGKIDIVNVDYSPQKMINEIIKIGNSRIGSKLIDLRVEIDENLPPVLRGDSARVKQVILNLITNAIKYTKQGYVLFKIDANNQEGKTSLLITVKDTGIGMTKEDIEMLFVKFQRFELDRNINISGTGLGMVITKGLVELMGGQITVDSVYEKGSTFTILLDQEISTKTLEEIADKSELGKIAPFDAADKKVLVVDDNKINLKVAEKLLEEYKLQPDLIDTGRECINKIMSGDKYDLIFLDIMMPKMKGPEVLENLKNIEGFNTPVVALTADVITGMEEKYLSQGFNDCLSKPIVEEELYYLLKKYLKPEEQSSVEIEINPDVSEETYEFAEVVPETTKEETVVEKTEQVVEEPTPVVAGSSVVEEEQVTEAPPVVEEQQVVEQAPETNKKPEDDFELPKLSEEPKEDPNFNFNDLPEVNYLTEIKTMTPDQIFGSSFTIKEPEDKFAVLEKNNFIVDHNDLARYNMSVEGLHYNIPLIIENLKSNKETENFDEYAKEAQSLKEQAKDAGCKKLSELAYEHELAGKACYKEYIDENFDTLKEEIEQVNKIIEIYIDR